MSAQVGGRGVEEAGYVYEALGGFYGGSKIVDSKRERLAIV